MTNTYLYIRYSDAKQEEGTSYERQLEKAKAYCTDKKITLIVDDDHIFFDAGKSAYKGEHLAEGGELKRFYDLVADKIIPSGSRLLVEDLDRLSRQTMWQASDKFRELTDAGITVTTLIDRKEWTGTGGFGDAMHALIKMDLSNQESAKKSFRVKGSWSIRYQKARRGEPIKIPLASWLMYGADGFAILKEPEVSAVRLIFNLCIAGRGMLLIAKELTALGHKPFRGEKWITASVLSILNNTATIGTYTPRDGGEAVEGYFEAAIDKAIFYEAQESIRSRAYAKATNQTKAFNVWQGIAKCSYCGMALHCLPKGRNNIHYLVCTGKIAGNCTKALNTRLDESEEVFKELLAQVDSLSLVQDDKAQTAKELRALEAMLTEQRRQHKDLGNAMAIRYTQQLDDKAFLAGKKLDELIAEKSILESKLTQSLLAEKDKAWFLGKLDLVSYEKREQANALLKRLGITVSLSGGKKSTYLVRNIKIIDNNPEFPHRRGQAILQMTNTEEGLMILSLTDKQHAKSAELDPSGAYSAKAHKLLRKSLGLDKKK